MSRNPYEVLGIPQNASNTHIRSAYVKLINEIDDTTENASTIILELSEAFQILSNESSRANFDLFGLTKLNHLDDSDNDTIFAAYLEQFLKKFSQNESLVLHDIHAISRLTQDHPFRSKLLFSGLVRSLQINNQKVSMWLIYYILQDEEASYRTKYASDVFRFITDDKLDSESKYLAGIILWNNRFISPNPEQAFYYLFDAYEAGVTDAKALVGEAFLKGIGIDRREDVGTAILKSAASEGSERAGREYVNALIHGVAEKTSENEILDLYTKLAHQDKIYVAVFIIRSCLGLGGKKHLNQVLEKIKNTESSQDHLILLNFLNDSKFQNFIMQDPICVEILNTFENNGKPNLNWTKSETSNSRFLAILSGLIYYLAQFEDHTFKRDWYEISIIFGCNHYGLNFNTVLEDTRKVGPVLVPISSQGVPIPKLAQDLISDTDKKKLLSSDKLIVWTWRKKLLWISLKLDMHSKCFGKNFFGRQDLSAILAAAYDGDHYEGLSFSLESYSGQKEHYMEDTFIRMERAHIQPAWLINTNIGRSIYWADRIMPTFGHKFLFSLRDVFVNAEQDRVVRENLPEFYKLIDMAHGTRPFNISRQSIDLDHIDVHSEHKSFFFGFKRTSYSFKKMDMRFDASYISYNADGSEKSRSEFANDQNTLTGRRAKIGTEMFDEIEMALPVFARIRFAMGIMRLFGAIRNDGYRPIGWLNHNITKTTTRAVKKGTNPRPVIRPFQDKLRFNDIGI